MNVLVLGGGKQGRAALYDLARSSTVRAVTCADADVRGLDQYLESLACDKVSSAFLDAADHVGLRGLMSGSFDVVIDLLPRPLAGAVASAAIETRRHLVNTNYDHELRDLGGAAATRRPTTWAPAVTKRVRDPPLWSPDRGATLSP